MSKTEKQKSLLQLQESLPVGLPQPPNWLVELARNVKKLQEVRQMKHKRDVNSNKPALDSEKKYQGIVLQSYKNALVQVDKIHMKAVIELKAIHNKSEKLQKYNESAQ